jgi:hypothetical protein
MADKVCRSRPLIGPGPKLGRIASRERIPLDFKEKAIAFYVSLKGTLDFDRLKVRFVGDCMLYKLLQKSDDPRNYFRDYC